MSKVFNFNGEVFSKDKMPIAEEININWSRNGDKSSPMHSISSYLAMFAPALPKYFINKYSKEGDLIYDPFSGRGTTALKSREMKRDFVGSDLNPYAIVLSRAKIAKASLSEVINKINELEIEFGNWIKLTKNRNKYMLKKYEEPRYFYSPKVLKQLIFLRNEYGFKYKKFNDIENIVFGFVLGLMHGPMRKDGTSIYFSLDMPNTISMSPNYVKKYALENGLTKPKVNIFELIRNRAKMKYDDILANDFNGNVFEINALHDNKFIRNNSVQLLITSPPYLSIVNYTNSNWLKLWILGFERKELHKIKLSDKLKIDSYTEFISNFLNNVYPKIKNNGYVGIIVGDVHETKLIESVWEKIQNNTNFKLTNIFWDTSYLQTKKVTNMLNNKKGKATTIEKVLLLKKHE